MSEQGPAPVKRGFDLTFNLGHVIILVGACVGFVGSHYLTDYRLAALERQNSTVQAKLDGFATLLINAAVTDQRMKDLERRLDIAERR